MRESIDLLKEHREIEIIDKEVDIYLEMAHIAYIEVKKSDSKALLFTKPVDRRNNRSFDAPVLLNLFGSKKRVELLVGDCDRIAKEVEEYLKFQMPSGIIEKIKMLPKLMRLKNLAPKRVNYEGICQEVVKEGSEIDLYSMPVLTTWEKDGGPFITMGQVYTVSLDGKLANLGMYRLQVYDKNHLGLHWQIHKDSNHFFNEYKKAKKKMPVSIAIGGDPLYTWCGTAPLPYGMFELLLYGFVKNKNAKLVKSKTNDIYIPEDVDYVIEGWVDTDVLRDEGPFGDHTGYYTPIEPYPVLEVSAITSRKNPIFLATVVGKPPLEDKYLGYATERIFLPLLKTNAPDLLDYYMPENGVFHNLILAKIDEKYPAHAKQMMHAFWGVGQMSFVKHAIFVGKDAPELSDGEAMCRYILDRFEVDNLVITEGVCDALDHSSPKYAIGGKLGIDSVCDVSKKEKKRSVENLEELIARSIGQNAKVEEYFKEQKSRVTIIGIDKDRRVLESIESLKHLKEHLDVVVFVENFENDLKNGYMLLWRVVNNIDAKRDIHIYEDVVFVDGTRKGELEGHTREWPEDTNCTKSVIESLRQRELIDVSDEFLKHFQIIKGGLDV